MSLELGYVWVDGQRSRRPQSHDRCEVSGEHNGVADEEDGEKSAPLGVMELLISRRDRRGRLFRTSLFACLPSTRLLRQPST